VLSGPAPGSGEAGQSGRVRVPQNAPVTAAAAAPTSIGGGVGPPSSDSAAAASSSGYGRVGTFSLSVSRPADGVAAANFSHRFVEEFFGGKKNAEIADLQAKIVGLEASLAAQAEEIAALKEAKESGEEYTAQ
jgi:hypothetical protein